MTRYTLKIVGGLGLAAALLGACGEGVLPETQGAVYYTPLETSSVAPARVEDPGIAISQEERERYGPILEGFQKNASMLLERSDVGPRLEQIETVHVVTGRYLELVALYQAEVARNGLDTAAAPALAWAWMQLGQQKLARDLIDRFLEERPDDPISHLLDGAYYLEEAEGSADAARKTIASWKRALELDPSLPTFKGLNARVMRQQIEVLERRLPPEAPAVAQGGAQGGAQGEAVAVAPVPEDAPAEVAAPAEAEAPQEAPAEAEAPQEAPAPQEAAPQEAAPQEPAPQEAAEPPVAVLVAQGQIALNSGSPDGLARARQLFTRALAAEPDHLEATIGLMHVEQRQGAGRAALATRLEALAAHPQLTARQAYELGLFAQRTVKHNALARRLLEKSKELDPAFAEQAGVDALLNRL